MAFLTAPFHDNMKRLFSPAAILTGGGSLAITGTKAGLATLKPQQPVQPTPTQAGTTPAKPASGGMAQTATSTALTGPMGIPADALNLGRNTLLGQ